MTQYRVLTGIDYPPDKRAESGTIVQVKPEVTFDPEAVDGDKDGFVQDGTEFQRPVEETK